MADLKVQFDSDSLSKTIPVLAQADGAPVDGDFDQTPPNGTIVAAHNGTRYCLYVRVGGSWTNMSPTT